jgi:hypothetical protein
MASIVVAGDTSGSITLAAPAVAGSNTLTLPANTGTVITTASTFAGTGPAFSACLSSTQNVTSATFTKAVLSNELFDTANCFDPTTNYRFTPNVAGYYVFIANGLAQLSSGTGSIALTQIRKNTTTVAQNEITCTFSNGLSLPVSTIQYMNGSTDYVELFLYNNGASSPSFGAGQENTVLSGFLVRAA